MKTERNIGRSIFRMGIITIAAFMTIAVSAQSIPKSKPVNLPRRVISAVDMTNMTFTVTSKGTNLVLFITSETRFFKDGKYAITQDFKVGDEIRGTMTVAEDNKHLAVRLYSGQTPKAPKSAKPAKKPASKAPVTKVIAPGS
ncbi:hypothetical protein GC207_06245 [bacterium]|nr:hypothetical protein [bacterium]